MNTKYSPTSTATPLGSWLVTLKQRLHAHWQYWNPLNTLKHLMLEDSQGLSIFEALAQAQQRQLHTFNHGFEDVPEETAEASPQHGGPHA